MLYLLDQDDMTLPSALTFYTIDDMHHVQEKCTVICYY